MKSINLKELVEFNLNEIKVRLGKVPTIGLLIHMNSSYDAQSKMVNITITSQSGKSSDIEIPEIESEEAMQEIVSGIQSEIAVATKEYSKTLQNIVGKYQ